MYTKAIAMVIIAAGLIFTAVAVIGHPGGLNAEGCHNNRKTGDYHCHRAQADPAQPRYAVPPDERARSGIVKKSQGGICHAPGTTYYARTFNFTSFKTLEACLESGGRLPMR